MNKIDNILKIQLLLKKLINELIYFLLTIKLKINNELSELKRGMGIFGMKKLKSNLINNNLKVSLIIYF